MKCLAHVTCQKKLFCSLYRKCKSLFYIRLMSSFSCIWPLSWNKSASYYHCCHLFVHFSSTHFPDQRSLITQEKHLRTRKENRTHQPNIEGVNTVTALFNNMRTLKFRSRPTNAFFAAVNKMFGGFSQLTTTAEHCFIVWTVHSYLITVRSAVVGGWEEPPNIWLTVAKNAFVGWALNFRVRMLLKGAVILELMLIDF